MARFLQYHSMPFGQRLSRDVKKMFFFFACFFSLFFFVFLHVFFLFSQLTKTKKVCL